ncbi:50S ribosomal protein L35ae [Candidatus Woesearchaeota archaeon]|jgi:large subunit ribosomal protein L35Ae|nr:50S ribosomal protein L35ae [Candidatus Woesearchaeota archaeon]MBT5271970.1 50S ribosomal protein L35ae [Candidatus Woesearchaeota archaeon]MBT6041078.1 50S ribosomal protein L35ae [Candidatus Woesearchaeota archaeon]MBT6337374.1 50S ribosomal protein L35ae [Candidatus Woesearchaeota archaeon]MBT7928282.1 50S ribosomal protein L35ae [Candidatus Woesearchaeota archaeon]
MEGTITSYRRGRTSQTDNQMIIVVNDVDSKEKAEKMIGKAVVFKSPAGKELKGKITGAHGGKGAVRALFETGMPGQSLGKKISIQ